jgi:hypothetical protein
MRVHGSSVTPAWLTVSRKKRDATETPESEVLPNYLHLFSRPSHLEFAHLAMLRLFFHVVFNLFKIHCYNGDETLAQKMQTLLPTKTLLPMVN